MKTYMIEFTAPGDYSLSYTVAVEADSSDDAINEVMKQEGNSIKIIETKQLFKKEVDISELIPVHLMPPNCC
jgi:hypothetical protein